MAERQQFEEVLLLYLQDISSATSALRSMQGFPFYDKPMVRCRPLWEHIK